MLNIIDEFTHECRACRIFLALTARRAWRSTLPSVVGGRPMILSAIAERLKPISHRPSLSLSAELLVSAICRLFRLLRPAGLRTLCLSPVGQPRRQRRNPLLAQGAR